MNNLKVRPFKQSILLIFTFFSVCLLYPHISAQQNRLVESVDIQGNRRLTDEELLERIKTRPGDEFDEKQLQSDLQSLLKLRLFDSTNTKVVTAEGVRGGIDVIFELQELPVIQEIKFNGLRHLTEKDVLDELESQHIKIEIGQPFQAQDFQKAQWIITKYLIKRGFAKAKVSVSTESMSAT